MKQKRYTDEQIAFALCLAKPMTAASISTSIAKRSRTASTTDHRTRA